MRKFAGYVSLCIAVCSFASAASAQPTVSQAVRDELSRTGTIRVIVTLNVPAHDSSVAPDTAVAFAAEEATISAVLDDVVTRVPAGLRVSHRYKHLAAFAGSIDRAGMAALAAMPDVRAIEVDRLESASLKESVPLVDAPANWAWGYNGNGWTVAVIDSGLQLDHPFYAGRIVGEGCYSNANNAGVGTSVCAGGVGASTAPGSGANCDSSIFMCNHGTHVAGIVGGSSTAMTGVAPNVSLMSIQVFTRHTSADICGTDGVPCVKTYVSDQIAGIDRVLDLAGPGNFAKIAAANMSLGGGQYATQAACDADNVARKAAIDRLLSAGIAPVISSGNEGYRGHMGAPACLSGVISVGSTDKSDNVSSFTNQTSFLSLMAPGGQISSSVAGSAYRTFDGTSMAAPHVAGAWAILKQAYPRASVSDILNALSSTGALVLNINGAWRRINVNAARLALYQTQMPGKSSTPTVTPTTGASPITISWRPPIDGGRVDGYTLKVGTSSGNYSYGLFDMGNRLSISSEIPNGTYYIRIATRNPAGEDVSNEITFRIGPVIPGRPAAPSVTPNPSTGPITISWAQPTDGPPAAGFVLSAGSSEGASDFGTYPLGSATSLPVGNPVQATYYVRVRGVNASGQMGEQSPDTMFRVMGLGAPEIPEWVTAGSSGHTVTLSWRTGGGGTPDSYELEALAQATGATYPISLPGSTTSQSFPNVPTGNFLVRVRARNARGLSDYTPQRLIAVGVPLATGDMQVTLTWSTTGDVDLHTIEPDSTHVFYGHTAGTTASLDVDNTSGHGPENIYVRSGQAASGAYQIYIVNYGGPAATATVQVRLRPGTPTEQTMVFTRTMTASGPGVAYNIADVNIRAGTITETTGTHALDGSVADRAAKPAAK